jgi:hypothetical protein
MLPLLITLAHAEYNIFFEKYAEQKEGGRSRSSRQEQEQSKTTQTHS